LDLIVPFGVPPVLDPFVKIPLCWPNCSLMEVAQQQGSPPCYPTQHQRRFSHSQQGTRSHQKEGHDQQGVCTLLLWRMIAGTTTKPTTQHTITLRRSTGFGPNRKTQQYIKECVQLQGKTTQNSPHVPRETPLFSTTENETNLR
jgi:hypothetical protein